MRQQRTYAVFADGDAAVEFATAAVDPGALQWVRRWEGLVHASTGMRAAALIVPDLSPSKRRQVAWFRNQRPLLPLVLVTAETAVNVRALELLPAMDRIVYLDEAARELAGALEAAAQHGVLMLAREAILTQRDPPTLITSTLAAACQRAAAIQTVQGLATGIAGYSISRFGQLWRLEISTSSHPKEFIDWLLATRAVIEWRRRESRSALAQRLGADRHVLTAALRRRFGTANLAELVCRMPEIALEDLMRIIGSPR